MDILHDFECSHTGPEAFNQLMDSVCLALRCPLACLDRLTLRVVAAGTLLASGLVDVLSCSTAVTLDGQLPQSTTGSGSVLPRRPLIALW
jgi:hypothetical protein